MHKINHNKCSPTIVKMQIMQSSPSCAGQRMVDAAFQEVGKTVIHTYVNCEHKILFLQSLFPHTRWGEWYIACFRQELLLFLCFTRLPNYSSTLRVQSLLHTMLILRLSCVKPARHQWVHSECMVRKSKKFWLKCSLKYAQVNDLLSGQSRESGQRILVFFFLWGEITSTVESFSTTFPWGNGLLRTTERTVSMRTPSGTLLNLLSSARYGPDAAVEHRVPPNITHTYVTVYVCLILSVQLINWVRYKNVLKTVRAV